jgi:hypothetical protein
MGFGPPSWYFPVLLVFGLSTEDTSLGVSLPLQCSRKESPRPSPVALSGLPGGARGFISRSHWLITVPLAGFPNLSAVYSSLRRPAIFRRVALVGFCPSGSCSFHEAPTTRHRRHALLTFIPSNWPVPVLGGNVRGRWNRCLGQSGYSLFVSSGPSSSWKSVRSSSQD